MRSGAPPAAWTNTRFSCRDGSRPRRASRASYSSSACASRVRCMIENGLVVSGLSALHKRFRLPTQRRPARRALPMRKRWPSVRRIAARVAATQAFIQQEGAHRHYAIALQPLLIFLSGPRHPGAHDVDGKLQTNLLSILQVFDFVVNFRINPIKRTLQTNFPSRWRQNCFPLRLAKCIATIITYNYPVDISC